MNLSPLKFSVVIPAYNRLEFLRKHLPALLELDYDNYEVIVVDDGSTDETTAYLGEIQDRKLRSLRIPNSERGRARNEGTKIATGNYITFLDSDDLLYASSLKKASEVILKNDKPEFVHLSYYITKGKNKVLVRHSPDPYKKLLKGNYLSCIGVFLREDIARKFPFNEERELSGTEDWLLWLKLGARYPMKASDFACGELTEHAERSVNMFNEEALLGRRHILIKELKKDPVFKKKHNKEIKKISAHMYTYIALHAAIGGARSKTLKYLLKGIGVHYRELFTRRTLGILKNIV